MMAVLRCSSVVEVRKINVPISGVAANGRPWSFTSVDVLDSDFNKSQLTLADGVDCPAKLGKYTIVVDVETDRRDKAGARVLSLVPASA